MPHDVLTPFKVEEEEDELRSRSQIGEFQPHAQQFENEVINLQITPDRQGSNNKKIKMY